MVVGRESPDEFVSYERERPRRISLGLVSENLGFSMYSRVRAVVSGFVRVR